MSYRKTMLAIALLICACRVPHGVEAESPRIPVTVYPAGAHIGYRPVLTNAEVDCMWGFTCEGGYLPNFHTNTQDALHRMGGWGQFAGIQRGGRTTMAFELFINRYDPVPNEIGTDWSELAFSDLKSALHVQGYHIDRREAGLVSVGHVGGALVAVQLLGKQDLVVMAVWSGTLEIEGIALYEHRSPAARQTAWDSLARQISRALKVGQ